MDEKKSDLAQNQLLYLNSNSIKNIDLYENVSGLVINSTNGVSGTQIQKVIDKYPNIEKLVIQGQEMLLVLNLSKLSNLKYLEIKNNNNLINVYGLEKLSNLKEFTFCDNAKIYGGRDTDKKILCDKIIELCNNGTRVNLDVRYMYIMKKLGFDFPDGIRWYEETSVSRGFEKNGKNIFHYCSVEKIQYTTLEMYKAMQKAESIVNKYIRNTDTAEEKIAIIYQWICENIKYDYDGVSVNEKHSKGTVNGFLKGSCVCEGYTRMMQLMLKMCNVDSTAVSCFVNDDCDDYIESAIRHGNHAILRINNLNWHGYYIDVTKGATLFRKGLPRKCFMVSKESLMNGIQLDDEPKIRQYKLVLEDNIETGPDFSEEEIKRLLDFASERIRCVDKINEENDNRSSTLYERWSAACMKWDDLQYKYKLVCGQLNDLENRIKSDDYETNSLLEIDGNETKELDVADLYMLGKEKASYERSIKLFRDNYVQLCREMIKYITKENGYSHNKMVKTVDELQKEKSDIIYKLDSLFQKKQMSENTYNYILGLVEKEYNSYINRKR